MFMFILFYFIRCTITNLESKISAKCGIGNMRIKKKWPKSNVTSTFLLY